MGFQVKGNLVDVFNHRIFPAEMSVDNGKIAEIRELSEEFALPAAFILPGFVDAHVHIESSMLVPSEFARLAVVHGTVATVSDPHEIANVCGLAGVEFMIKNGRTVPFKFNFGAPSCVPATIFETAGAVLDSGAVEKLLRKPEIAYLSEMMNFPGVLGKDEEVMKKIAAAARLSKPVDGHAPGLRGEQAKQYISAGISTDHECFTEEEALDKLKYGMKILIREGSAAKNFDVLAGLIEKYPAFTMLCSDDKHPDSLVRGHINQLCARAVAKGIGIFPILQAACVNPVQHYKLPVGLLRVNDPADFILVRDLKDFQAIQTYIDGKLVAENGRSLIQTAKPGSINHFGCSLKNLSDFAFSETNFPANQMNGTIEVIEALDGQLITNKLSCNKKDLVAPGGSLQSNTGKDILKIVVVNRYRDSPVAKSFIHNLGLKKGAIASSVAHDSHNIVAAGVDDENICRAVNLIIAQRGGISCVVSGTPDSKEERENERVLPLPVAGLMSDGDGYQVATEYTAIDAMAKSLGCRMSAPFMTLSFMALLVIPHLKLSDLGLFDADQFKLL